MRFLIKILLVFLTTNLFSQNLKTIIPKTGKKFDFSIQAQSEWTERDKLLREINKGNKTWDRLTKEEKKLFDKHSEIYTNIWDIIGGGCSWYCGMGRSEVKTSSELPANGKIDYKSRNLFDLDYQTAWVEGKKGYGIGETIEYIFPATTPRITTIIFVNGYVKSKKAWRDNSRVHKLKMYVNNKPFAIIDLKDVYAEQIVKLPKPLGYSNREDIDALEKEPNWHLKFEILSVYKGDKYDDTAITEIYFDGIDVHCLAKGTLITMSDNTQKSIENLQIGDKILSYNILSEKYETSVIQELASPLHENLVKLEFSNGQNIICTKDHPFLLGNAKWGSFNPIKTEEDYEISKVVSLHLGSQVKTLHGNLEIKKISQVPNKQRTYTIVALDKNSTFIANGIITGIEKLRKTVVVSNNLND